MSMIYDIAWEFINRDIEQDDSGGVEQDVKRFSTLMSYISFVFRVSSQFNHVIIFL